MCYKATVCVVPYIVFHNYVGIIMLQHSFCVALENGDVLKCNTERTLYESDQFFVETPRILYPNVSNF